MLKLHDIPGDQPISFYFPGHATAGTAVEQIGFRTPFACTVTAVQYTPNTTQTGADTDYATLTVFNRTTGAGSTSVATLAFTSGVDLTALTPKTITVSATAANLNLAEGDVVSAGKVVAGNGRAFPPGVVTVHLKAR